ncbi:MAG: S26 family signal peptidase, partial [Gemmataceae bacterium]|nr:S26 family signal peptidase [Gemmataceae bacterium]
APPPQPASPAESAREVVETIVFVVVLVLLLKSFVAEAFVIPTGSMAPTLYGYQMVVGCPACGHRFPINCSDEVEEGRGELLPVERCVCPNCRLKIELAGAQPRPPRDNESVLIANPGWRSGDRVLVAKYPYDIPGLGPERHHVVVFKFPGGPPDDRLAAFPDSGPFGKNGVPMNYIKRLIGLPGETIAVHRGKVFVLAAGKAAADPADEEARRDPWRSLQLWQWKHMHLNSALDRFEKNEFKIIRKKPVVLLETLRLVYDNDLPAKDLLKDERHVRWTDKEKAWSADGRGFKHNGALDRMAWLRYRHVLRDLPGKPQLITDFTGYNTSEPRRNGGGGTGRNWASDLALECETVVEKAEGKFALEVSRGKWRWRAVFEPETGECALFKVGAGGETELARKPTPFKGTGTFRVRFANCDDKLTVWVNGSLPFGDGVEYDDDLRFAPTKENDLERPASAGAQGGKFTVRKLKLLRDICYTVVTGQEALLAPDNPDGDRMHAAWSEVKGNPASTYFVQPGHYLCLGDNSPESSDSRMWGVVPQRLMLGRAVAVYFPFTRVGRIR